MRPVKGFTTGQVLDAAASTIFVRPGHRAHHATDDAIRRALDEATGSPVGHGSESVMAPVERDAFLPFQSGRPFAAALFGTRLMIKAAPEVLSSALTDDEKPLTRMIGEMTAQGLRVLAVAERELSPDQAAAASCGTFPVSSGSSSTQSPTTSRRSRTRNPLTSGQAPSP